MRVPLPSDCIDTNAGCRVRVPPPGALRRAARRVGRLGIVRSSRRGFQASRLRPLCRPMLFMLRERYGKEAAIDTVTELPANLLPAPHLTVEYPLQMQVRRALQQNDLAGDSGLLHETGRVLHTSHVHEFLRGNFFGRRGSRKACRDSGRFRGCPSSARRSILAAWARPARKAAVSSFRSILS